MPTAPVCKTLAGRVLWVIGAALVLGALASSADAPLFGRTWFMATTLTAGAAYCLGRCLPDLPSRILRASIGVYAAVLSISTLAAAATSVARHMSVGREQLLFSSPNLLASGLAVSSTSAMLILPGRWKLVPSVLAIPALYFTGSRVALAAAVLAFTWLLALSVTAKRGSGGIPAHMLLAVVAAVGGMATAATWVEIQTSLSRNLLAPSVDFNHPRWDAHNSARFSASVVPSPGPAAGGRVSEIVAASSVDGEYPGLVLAQVAGNSDPQVNYVASAYFRSNTPQQLVLNSNRSRATCPVDDEWSRCVTPPAPGKDGVSVQFQIWTLRPGDEMNVQIWGAQLEEGNDATTPVHNGSSLLARWAYSELGERMSLAGLSSDESLAMKTAGFSSAWQRFRSSPLLGDRRPSSDTNGEVAYRDGQAHAHNIVLELLAETGLVGFAWWAVLFIGIPMVHEPKRIRHALPLMATVIVLNTLDFTYFHGGSYYVYWASLGLILARSEG